MTGVRILITGGTGTLGRAVVSHLHASNIRAEKIVIFSRDEWKHDSMQAEGGPFAAENMRYIIGDVRDVPALRQAMEGMTHVIHAAALKRVPSCEYSPNEAIRTNIAGSMNVVHCAVDAAVHRLIGVSSDKAVHPANIYGVTKAAMEKVFIRSNTYARHGSPSICCVRYGNVAASRGSVLEIWNGQKESGKPMTITEPAATRFWMSIRQAAEFVVDCLLEREHRGLIYVPVLGSASVMSLAEAAGAKSLEQVECTGLRPGEKMHECLVSPEEARHTVLSPQLNEYWILPENPAWDLGLPEVAFAEFPAEGYTSENAPHTAGIVGAAP